MGILSNIDVGDIVIMKKKHPCGSDKWEILRVGADLRLKCKGCNHQMVMSRSTAEKNIKNIQENI